MSRSFRWILPIVASLTFVGVTVAVGKGSKGPELRSAIAIAQAAQRANLKNVLVADFPESERNRTQQGVYFAAVFSKTLSEHAASFEVIGRQKWFALLQREGIALSELEKPEVLLHVGTELGAEALVLGRVDKVSKGYKIAVSLRSTATGQELARESYSVPPTPDLSGHFPATSDLTGTQYYFAGFDGVTAPKCISCTNPSYTQAARERKIQGTVILSAVISSTGRGQRTKSFWSMASIQIWTMPLWRKLGLGVCGQPWMRMGRLFLCASRSRLASISTDDVG